MSRICLKAAYVKINDQCSWSHRREFTLIVPQKLARHRLEVEGEQIRPSIPPVSLFAKLMLLPRAYLLIQEVLNLIQVKRMFFDGIIGGVLFL
jgi:hypothetical protein